MERFAQLSDKSFSRTAEGILNLDSLENRLAHGWNNLGLNGHETHGVGRALSSLSPAGYHNT